MPIKGNDRRFFDDGKDTIPIGFSAGDLEKKKRLLELQKALQAGLLRENLERLGTPTKPEDPDPGLFKSLAKIFGFGQ